MTDLIKIGFLIYTGYCYFISIINNRGLDQSRLELSSHKRKVGYSNPSRDGPKSLKQVVTVPLLNARTNMLLLKMPIQTDVPCHSTCNTLKNTNCLMVISV